MSSKIKNLRLNWHWFLIALCATLLPTALLAAPAKPRVIKPTPKSIAKAALKPTSANSVEMFAAMKTGELDVKLIPRDDREARVQIKNNTKQPLNVLLPDAFAGVPVLAQARAPGAGGGGGQNNMNQGMGGGMGGMGMGGMGMGGMGMGGGMGMMSVPPEKIVEFKVTTVCLEHGKKDPRPSVPYEIRPIDSFTTKPGVAELLTLLGKGKINQRAAQAAAWHLANDMSWEQLAAKRIEELNGSSEPYFSGGEINDGVQVANVAITAAATRDPKESDKVKSPGDRATTDR